MKVVSSLSFYHIPKFLKNDSEKVQKSTFNLQLKEMLISKLSTQETAVSGGAKRDRTVDLLRARQALSQLSYGPVFLQAFPTQNGWVWADSICKEPDLTAFYLGGGVRSYLVPHQVTGGSGQIRTADLTLIRGAL